MDFNKFLRSAVVFPCRPKGKEPLVKWTKEATSKISQKSIWKQQFPGCNWAIKLGFESGLFVLDIDDLDLYEKKFVKTYARLPETLTVKTARGYHFYYKLPYQGKKFLEIRNSTNLNEYGIDIKGQGGYVIIPPSIHPSGVQYQWDNRVEPAYPPEWLISLVMEVPSLPQEESGHSQVEEGLPGDRYNESVSLETITHLLESAGWKRVRGGTDGNVRFRRPGKKRGHSATYHVEKKVFYVFSSNAPPFEAGRAYSPFALLALLRFNGDFKACARHLSGPKESPTTDGREEDDQRAELEFLEAIEDTDNLNKYWIKEEVLPDFLKRGLDVFSGPMTAGIRTFAAQLVFTAAGHQATSLGYSLNNRPPTFASIKLGLTGDGKTRTDNAFKEAIFNILPDQGNPHLSWNIVDEIASGSGLWSRLAKENFILMVDEGVTIFAQDIRFDWGKREALMKMATMGTAGFIKSYSEKTIEIPSGRFASIIINGNEYFTRSINNDDVITGLLRRMLFFVDFRKHKKLNDVDLFSKNQTEINQWILDLVKIKNKLTVTEEAKQTMNYFANKWHRQIDTEEARIFGKERISNMLKFAQIFALCNGGILGEEEAERAAVISDNYYKWLCNALSKLIMGNKFIRDQETILDVLESFHRHRKGFASYKVLAKRKAAIREMTPLYFQQVINVLESLGMIEVKKNGDNPTAVSLKRTDSEKIYLKGAINKNKKAKKSLDE